MHRRFGTSFPIRFDYLDTMGGGNLSLHCHPQEQYMREVFGWPYTQHETYYVTASEAGAQVLLGLTEQADLDLMRRQVEDAIANGTPMPVEDHIQTHPATVGRLFMIPAGTPHASGAGNLVLEVSATPYLYSLRFYDWLRKDAMRRVPALALRARFRQSGHLSARGGRDEGSDPATAHAARGRGLARRGRRRPAGDVLRRAPPGRVPGRLHRRRHRFYRFHILNLAAGQGAVIETRDGRTHSLAFAETITVPAAVGPYRVRSVGDEEVHIVKALVVEP